MICATFIITGTAKQLSIINNIRKDVGSIVIATNNPRDLRE